MDLRRLRAGEWLAGVSGLVLLVALFLPWYGDDAGSRTGWESLGALDVVLAVVALSALAIPVVTALERVPAVPLAHQSLTTLVGLLAVVLVLIRVLNMPDWAAEREWGLWVALAATLGIASGGLVAMRDERLTRGERHTDLTGVPVAAPPDIEKLPAPRPEAGP
jgi:heme A synthase